MKLATQPISSDLNMRLRHVISKSIWLRSCLWNPGEYGSRVNSFNSTSTSVRVQLRIQSVTTTTKVTYRKKLELKPCTLESGQRGMSSQKPKIVTVCGKNYKR